MALPKTKSELSYMAFEIWSLTTCTTSYITLRLYALSDSHSITAII